MVVRLSPSCSLTRPFRLALVLITLLLTLPQMAWGQDDGTTYTFTGTSITGNTGTATSTSGGTAYNWNIKEFQLLDGQNEATGINPTYSNSSLGISNFGNNDKAIEADFLLESNFGFTGSFVKAEITFSASNLTNATFNIKKVIDNNNTADLAEYYINGVSDPEYTITISRPSQNNNNRLLDDNKIVFHFNFKANTGHPEASFSITSIKIYTTEYFGLTVGGVRVSSGNYKDITGGNIAFGSGGNASFDPNERILTLNNTTIHGSIYSYGNMTIDLQGTNTINADTCAIKNTNITSGNPSGTLNIKTTDGTGSLKLNHGTGPEESPTITQYFTVSYTGTGLRLIGSYDQNSQDALFAVQILGGYDNDDNSYLIKTPEQLKTFSEYVNSGMITDGTIKLYNDVDCSTLTGFVPIGNSTHKFSSYFKGNDKTISNLTISSTGDAGLFGVIYNGTVDYLNLTNCTIAGGDYAGAVVGKLESGSVKYVKVKGTTSVTAVNPGAIVGDLPAISNVLETRYEYSVTTTVTNGETSSGYTPRAVGRIQGGAGGDVRDVARATLYTKTLSTSSGSNGEVRTWYISTNTYTNNGETSGSFAPGQTAYFKVAPNSGYRVSSVSVTYTEGSTTINPVLDEGNSTNEYSIYYFTMPDAAVTASATFTNGYGITIAGTEVTSENATTGITAGDGKVYYNATNNILTLNGATINGVIESTIGDLTIHLTGNSTIKATGNETSLISSTNNGTLTFETDANPIGSLELLSSTGGPFANTPWSGFTNVVYSGLDYSSTEKKVGLISYSIVVGVGGDQNGTEVTSANKNDVLTDGTVSFDSENNTLTLNGAEITKAIEYSGSTLLTIALKGTNRINNDTGTYGICSTGGSLNIVKATDATSAELTISFYGGTNVPISASYTLGSGLYLKPVTNSKSIITEDPEFVTVDGYLIPDGGSVSDGDAGTITYSASDKTLTITSFNKTFYTDAIQTGISGLKVKLVGASTITCDSYYAFSAFATGASIQFIKDDATSKLTMTGTAFNNFGSSSITYDGLFYYSDNTNKVITQATAPKLSRAIQYDAHNLPYTYALIDYADADKSGGSVLYSAANPLLKYSFDYADPQKQDVSNQVYPEAGIKMTDPGILTTWVEVGTYKGPESKGVRFGLLENPIEIEFDGTKQISITPAPTMTNPVTIGVYADYTENFDGFAVLDNQNNKITINTCYDGLIGFTFANTDGGYTSLNMDSTKVAFHVIPSKPTLSLESGAYYIGQQITATPTVPDGSYNTYFKINGNSAPDYTYTFNSAGIYDVSSVTYFIRGGGLGQIFGKYAEAKIIINNEPTFTASVGQNADPYNAANPQAGDVEVQLAVTDLQNNCTLMYYLDSDAGNPQPYQSSISLSETTTINAFIRYTDNTVTPNIVYDSAPVSKTYTVKQALADPFGNDLSYKTWYLSDYSLNKPDGIKVYIITGVSGNSVTTTAIDYIPQGVAVLLEKDGNTPAGGYVAETYTGAAGNFSGNMLKYANAAVTATDDLYILYKNEFVKATGVIPIENCYLDLSSVNPSRGMYDIGDGATAIKGITLSEGEERWYDLQGRRIERPTKPGLYIRNGKKVVVNNK